MAEFQELIKNFDRIRDYMRQFYIYGFKVRNDFDSRSARTYDNERRRIESWLGDYTCSSYTTKGKQVYIDIDSKTVPENPLYARPGNRKALRIMISFCTFSFWISSPIILGE